MQTVSKFEANLLRLLYFFLRREPAERALPLVEMQLEPPSCLSRKAVELAQKALAVGSTYLLSSRGGWRDERHLREEKIVEGRLWQRTTPEELGLSFSQHSMEFLIWMTACRPNDKDTDAWSVKHSRLTVGDLLLLFFAHEGLREAAESLGFDALRKKAPYAQHALCWLAYPEDYAKVPDKFQPDFRPWMSGVGACILEALQTDLAQRWVQIESNKERLSNPNRMRALGQSQERVLCAFLDATEKADRRDLARFLVQAGNQVIADYARPQMWIGGLNTQGIRLTDRASLYQAAMVFVRYMERLNQWTQWARSVGYWDEGYQQAQLWKADWDYFQGDDLSERARRIVQQTDPLRQAPS